MYKIIKKDFYYFFLNIKYEPQKIVAIINILLNGSFWGFCPFEYELNFLVLTLLKLFLLYFFILGNPFLFLEV